MQIGLDHIIRRQFQKTLNAAPTDNITILEDPLRVKIGDGIYVTANEIITPEYTIPYETIESHSLPSFSEERIRNGTAKQAGYDTVVIDTYEGEFELHGLGHAVFPLHNVLHFIQRRKS